MLQLQALKSLGVVGGVLGRADGAATGDQARDVRATRCRGSAETDSAEP